MKKQPPVDILMATYNGAPYLKEQIDSILAQDYDSIRLIISDDGSTDATRDILEFYAKEYPSIIRLLPYGKNLGVKGNFSRLLECATAEYIFLSDQDDVWDCDKVAKSMDKMQELEELHGKDLPLLVHTDLKVVDQYLRMLSRSFWSYIYIDPFIGKTLNRLLVQNVVTGCATLINLPLLKLVTPIPEYCIMHDWWMALVASSFGKAEPLPSATIAYRQHGKNTLGANKYCSWTCLKKAFKKLGDGGAANRAQAKELLNRFDDQLGKEQKEIVEAFLSITSLSLIQKAFLVVKYGFYHHGLVRNLARILTIKVSR